MAAADRYKPRHLWYLADAQLIVRSLQALVWPMGWHIALGGGVLNHGYSDKDLDLYVLPIYNSPHEQDELAVLTKLVNAIQEGQEYEPVCSLQDNPHECYKYAVRMKSLERPIELFIVRRVTGTA